MIRGTKNFYTGLMFVLFGAAGVYFGSDLTMGSAVQMGPGYFPRAVSWGLAGIGLIVAVRGFVVEEEGIETLRLRALFWVIVSVILFAFLARPLGIFLSVGAMALVASFGDRSTRLIERLALASGLALGATLIFVYGIGLPLKVLPL